MIFWSYKIEKPLVQKGIKTKSRASFLLSSMLQKIDQQVDYSKQLVKNTKFSSQELPIRDLRTKSSNSQNQDFKLVNFWPPKSVYKACKKSKKDRYNRKQDSKAQEYSTPATGVNGSELSETNKKKKKRVKQDFSSIIYYNYDKKYRYSITCPQQ